MQVSLLVTVAGRSKEDWDRVDSIVSIRERTLQTQDTENGGLSFQSRDRLCSREAQRVSKLPIGKIERRSELCTKHLHAQTRTTRKLS